MRAARRRPMTESAKRISYLPTPGLSYDPNDLRYWDRTALHQEVERAFEICHGCRMCFKYCDSFPLLFKRLDTQYDGDVRKLSDEDTSEVFAACFQCKLCEVQCPYTPRDQHEFQLDFPKLVHRYRAVMRRREGPKFRDHVLGNPDTMAEVARASFGMANAMNRVQLHRWLMEKVLGVHREKLLPEFASETFEAWAREQGKIVEKPENAAAPEAVLFQTCYVQHNEPEIGRDTLEVLERNRVRCGCVAGLRCCGMPAWESGDLESLRAQAKTNLDRLEPFVERGTKVLAINPTCSMMLRREYPQLLDGHDRERAVALSAVVMDPSEFLWSIRQQDRFNTDVPQRPELALAYHAPCHLRAQGVGFKGRDLIRKVLGCPPATVLECCGHNGTYAMTTEGFAPSKRIGEKAFSGMKECDAALWVTDCPLAAIQFQQHAGVKPMHPMSVLAKAYRGEL